MTGRRVRSDKLGPVLYATMLAARGDWWNFPMPQAVKEKFDTVFPGDTTIRSVSHYVRVLKTKQTLGGVEVAYTREDDGQLKFDTSRTISETTTAARFMWLRRRREEDPTPYSMVDVFSEVPDSQTGRGALSSAQLVDALVDANYLRRVPDGHEETPRVRLELPYIALLARDYVIDISRERSLPTPTELGSYRRGPVETDLVVQSLHAVLRRVRTAS